MKQRLTYIDALRGFAIFLVALGHVTDLCGYTYSFLCGFIYSFHMPLFMAIAGFVCAYSATDTLCVEGKGGFWKFIWKKFRFIMIPYFVWALVVQPFFFNPWTGGCNWMEAFEKACIINDSFWFLPCLFLLQVGYAVYKWLRENIKVKHWALDLALVAALGAVTAVLYYFTKIDFFRSVLSYWLPFWTGIFMGQYSRFDKFVTENKWLYAITVVALCLAGGLYNSFEGIAEKGIRLACGMISIPVWFGFFKGLQMPEWLSKAMCYTGKNTLVIYVMQMCLIPGLPQIPGLNPFLQIVVFSIISILMIIVILGAAKVLEQNIFLLKMLV